MCHIAGVLERLPAAAAGEVKGGLRNRYVAHLHDVTGPLVQ